jgi:hypothetical protein
MSRLKLILAIALVFTLIGSITSIATPGSHSPNALLPVADSINSVALANNGLCPCGNPAHDEDTEEDDTRDHDIDTDDEITVNDSSENEGTRGDSADDDDTGDDNSDDDNSDDDNTDDDNSDDDNSDNECTHQNRCPVCDDCLDCGNNPCPDCCDDGRRCGDCSCDYCGDFCYAIPIRERLFIIINDRFLRIGSALTFTTNANPSDYLIQWSVDGKEIHGANGRTYIVRPTDADKKITVALISPCCNELVESPPTDYIPYTISLVAGNTEPMGNDDVFFGIPGIVTAYAASKDNGFVDICYTLYDSGLDSDNLAFSLDSISNISNIGSGTSRYNVIASDAVNGDITIIATFYHRGISIAPVCGHVFDDHDCGGLFDEYFSLSITQLGNAPTGPIILNISGADSDAFYLSTYNIPSIDINDSTIIDAGIRTDNVPTGYYYNIYTAQIDVSGDYLNIHTAPVSVRIAHSYSPLIYRGGFHNQYCTGCNLYRRGFCSYSHWSVLAGAHSRSCSICLGEDSHAPVWSPWSQLNNAEHLRTCTLCSITQSEPHTWGAWANLNATHHRRTCSLCSRNDDAAHTWGAWINLNTTHHRRTCSLCSRNDDAAHTWGTWANLNTTHHRRTCSLCSENDDTTHTWEAWTNLNTTHHRRTCSDCSGYDDAAHTWGAWTNLNSAHHRRTCSDCSGNDDAAHAWGAWTNLNSAHHRRTCSDCSNVDDTGHSFWFTTFGEWHHRRRCHDCNLLITEDHYPIADPVYRGFNLTGNNAHFHFHLRCGICNVSYDGGAGCVFRMINGMWECIGTTNQETGIVVFHGNGCGFRTNNVGSSPIR